MANRHDSGRRNAASNPAPCTGRRSFFDAEDYLRQKAKTLRRLIGLRSPCRRARGRYIGVFLGRFLKLIPVFRRFLSSKLFNALAGGAAGFPRFLPRPAAAAIRLCRSFAAPSAERRHYKIFFGKTYCFSLPIPAGGAAVTARNAGPEQKTA